jgi:hypothetical protein
MIRLAGCLFLLPCLFGQNFDPKLPAPVPAVDGSLEESPKVRYIDVRKGDGPLAAAGQRYTLIYTGWLRDGKKFSSADDPQHPFQFVQGRRQVIAGFELGFDGIRVGGKRRVFLPYQLAYGERGNPPSIPPRSESIFDLELLAVENVPDELAAADLLLTLSDYQDRAMALAKAVPERKYDWRPAPGMQSFREVFAAMAISAGAEPKVPSDKAAVLAMLAGSFSALRKSMESARGGTLIHEVQLSGRTTTQRGVFVATEARIAECLGEAMVYARMNAIAK